MSSSVFNLLNNQTVSPNDSNINKIKKNLFLSRNTQNNHEIEKVYQKNIVNCLKVLKTAPSLTSTLIVGKSTGDLSILKGKTLISNLNLNYSISK